MSDQDDDPKKTTKPNIFANLEALRLSPGATGTNTIEILSRVPVRKPTRQEFFRVNPDEKMSLLTTLYFDNEERETFLVSPDMRVALGDEIKPALVVVAMTRQSVLLLWPVKLPNDTSLNDGWQKSAQEAASHAKSHWTRMASDMALGAYRIYKAEADLQDPEWPDKTFSELLEIGFRDRTIDSVEHPVIKRLRGQV